MQNGCCEPYANTCTLLVSAPAPCSHEQEEPAGEVAPPPAPPEPMPSGGLKRRPPGFLARLAVNVKHDQAHGGHTPLSLAVLLKNVEVR